MLPIINEVTLYQLCNNYCEILKLIYQNLAKILHEHFLKFGSLTITELFKVYHAKKARNKLTASFFTVILN